MINPILDRFVPSDSQSGSQQPRLLESEVYFYSSYPWALNAFPTVQDATRYLREELQRLLALPEEWQRTECMINVFLLSSSITDSLDDYLLGTRYEFCNLSALPFMRPAVRVAKALVSARTTTRGLRLAWLRRWKEQWQDAVRQFLALLATSQQPESEALERTTTQLVSLLTIKLPSDFLAWRPTVPAAFRSQDLSHFDVLALGKAFTDGFRDRRQPILVVGCRTAGSYFAPLLAAYLDTCGYQQVEFVTLRTKRGASPSEARILDRYATVGSLALVIDEPAFSGGTLAGTVGLICKAGFPAANVVVLVPVHPTRLDWKSSGNSLRLQNVCIVCLQPEQYYKYQALAAMAVELRLKEYFSSCQYSNVQVIASEEAARFNSELERHSERKLYTRLKRVYAVKVQTHSGQVETRYVLAKSVGWGWLGYQSFLAGQRLSSFVPQMLGLRDGILYTEWFPGRAPEISDPDRGRLIGPLASYVAARARLLKLKEDPSADLSRTDRNNGLALLGSALSNVYGPKVRALMRARINQELARRLATRPTLIDGKMRLVEWIRVGAMLLKADFEQHGLGKLELNITDPTYDLAEAILHFELSVNEETDLVGRYVEASADADIGERLFLNKLLAGLWTMRKAMDGLGDARLVDHHETFNRQYLSALSFLVVQTARFCGGQCRPPKTQRENASIVVLDIDGVLDKHAFGFPSTTSAGIQAVSVLHAHKFAIAVNSARTLAQVKAYCVAYGFVGGVAEYGAVAWNAMSGQERVLVSPESLAQLARVRDALQKIPGIFLNDDYRYSIRAFTYDDRVTVPVPTMLVRNLLAVAQAERLTFHQSELDTTIVARETDKGHGLLALIALGHHENAEVIAIGDSRPDLAMFRVAKQSFAPAQISCRAAARDLGCQITKHAYQLGLLSAVQSVVHKGSNRRCALCRETVPATGSLILDLLQIADENRVHKWLRAVIDPKSTLSVLMS